MSEGASQPRPGGPPVDKYGLMSSIAAVREIVLKNAVTESDVVDELNTQKQNSYQERVQLQEEVQRQRSLLKDLGSKAEHAREEAQREKTMRLALEQAQSKLEDHRNELTSQLETTKASQAVMEDKIIRFHEDLDQQNLEFEKERAKWEELVKTMRSQDETSKKEIGQLDARLLTSQQETKDMESQLRVLKKEIESIDTRHNETVQGYKNVIDKLNKRIEVGQVDTIEGLQKRITEAESNYETTLEKLRNAREDLLSFRQFSGQRHEEVLSKKNKQDVCEELESAESSLNDAEKELEASREALAKLEGDASSASEKNEEDLIKYKDDVARAKEDVEKKRSKITELLTKIEGLYQRRLELSKSEVSSNEQDLETVTERLRLAKEDTAAVQATMESIQSKKTAFLGGKDASKKRAAEGETTTGEKRRKQS